MMKARGGGAILMAILTRLSRRTAGSSRVISFPADSRFTSLSHTSTHASNAQPTQEAQKQ